MSRKKNWETAEPLNVGSVWEYDIEHMFKTLKIKKGQGLVGIVIPDTHFPDQCEESLSVLKQIGAKLQPEVLIHIGDFYDMGCISPHEGKGRVDECVQDILGGRKLMEEICTAVGDPTFKFFCCGNHEQWFSRYIESAIPRAHAAFKHLGIDISVESLCKFGDLDFEVIPHNSILRVGELCFTHGFYTSKYHASKMVDVVGSNVMYGHTESIQSHYNVSVRGVKMAQNIGTMRNPAKATWMCNRPHAWVNGFAIVVWRRDGSFTHYPITIIDGKCCMPDGTLIEA